MHSDAFSHTTSDEVSRSDGHTLRRHLRASDSRAAKTEQASATTSDPTCPFVARSREPFHRRRSDKRLRHLVWAWLRFQERPPARSSEACCKAFLRASGGLDRLQHPMPAQRLVRQAAAKHSPQVDRAPIGRSPKFQGARLTGSRASRKLLCVIRLHRPVAGHFQSKYSAPRAGPPPTTAASPLQLLTIARLPAHNTRFFSGTLSKTPIFSLHILSAFSYKPSDTHSTW